MALPYCHSRIPLEAHPDVFFCAHPSVHAKGSLVHAGICSICSRWQEPTPEHPRPFDPLAVQRLSGSCRHLGELVELRDCESCAGKVKIKVYACAHPAHGTTTIPDCQTCRDFAPREQKPSGAPAIV